jgi:hypothetical protein
VFFTGSIVANIAPNRGPISGLGIQAAGGMALFIVMLLWGNSGGSPAGSRQDVETQATLQALARIFQSIDDHYPTFVEFARKSAAPGNRYRVVAKATRDRIDFIEGGRSRMTITADDLEKPPPDDRKFIKSIEKSLAVLFDEWTSLYPKRVNTDSGARKKIEERLDKIASDICSDLNKIFRHLGSLGYELEDHYSSMRSICKEHQGPT